MGIGRGILITVGSLAFVALLTGAMSIVTVERELTDASVTCVSGGHESFRQTSVARVTFSDSWIILSDPTQPKRQVRLRGDCTVAGTVP